jgi:hypothetical protein
MPRTRYRPFSRQRVTALLLLILFVLASCGSEEQDATSTSSVEERVVTTNSVTVAPSSGIAEPGSEDRVTVAPSSGAAEPGSEVTADVDTLRDRIDKTVARRTAAFALDVTQTLPAPEPNSVSTLRTGAFDDELLIGRGTLRFESASDEIAEVVGAGAFEFRLIDDTYWLLNALGEPPAWIGYDLFEFAGAAGGDPTLPMDGDLFILVVADAVIDVAGFLQGADRSETWSVIIRADDLLPLVATTGVQRRLLAAGFESTDLTAAAEIVVDPNGMVTGFESELDEWWQQVTATVLPVPPELRESVTMRVRFELGDFDSLFEVAVPCANPVELDDPEPVRAVTCEDG